MTHAHTGPRATLAHLTTPHADTGPGADMTNAEHYTLATYALDALAGLLEQASEAEAEGGADGLCAVQALCAMLARRVLARDRLGLQRLWACVQALEARAPDARAA
jgi:hypothetical protein